MIEHKTLPRESLNKFCRDRKMFCVDQDVVGEVEFLQQCDASKKIRPQEKAIVSFRLHDVANANKLRISGENAKLRAHIRRTQIDPPNHSNYLRRPVRQPEEPSSLFQRLSRLNGDRSLKLRCVPVQVPSPQAGSLDVSPPSIRQSTHIRPGCKSRSAGERQCASSTLCGAIQTILRTIISRFDTNTATPTAARSRQR